MSRVRNKVKISILEDNDEEEEEESDTVPPTTSSRGRLRSRFSGSAPRSLKSKTESRPRLPTGPRVVPTGKRRRQKFGKNRSEEENDDDIEDNNLPEEEDRRSANSAPRRKLNRLPGQFTSRRKTTNPTEAPVTRIPSRRRFRPSSFGKDQESPDFQTESPQFFIDDDDEETSSEVFSTTNENGISVLPISTAAGVDDESEPVPSTAPPPSIFFDGFRVSPAVPIIQDDVSKILPPGFVLPSDENESVQTQPTTSTEASTLTTKRTPLTTTAVTQTSTTTTTTTTVQTTTTSQPFKFTPLPTEPTTPRVYVSTSNFRPTLPTLEPEEQTPSEIFVVETSSIGNLNQPLVLAPQAEEYEESSSSSQSAIKATSSTQIQSTSSSKSSVSTSSTSESNYNINNRLDELASNLDPWAHIQHAQHKENLEKEALALSTTTTTTTPTTTTAEDTTKLSLFTIKTTDTTTTVSTTTFKVKSLKELLDHRNGGVTSEFPIEEENTIPPIQTTTTTKNTTRRPYSPRKSAASSVRSKFRPKRPQKENEETRTPKEEKERLIEGKDVPETNRISTTFKDRFKLKELPIKKDDINKFLPEGYKPSTRTKANSNSDSLLRELLNKLKDKDLA